MNNNIPELDEMAGIMDDFLIEADEISTALDNHFVELESQPDNLDLLNEIFRAVHTIKGASGFLALDDVTRLSHKMEDILNKLRKTELKVTSDIMDVLLEALDYLKRLIDNVRYPDQKKPDLAGILYRLEIIADDETSSDETAPKKISSNSNPNAGVDGNNITSVKSANQTIRVDVERLDTLMNMMGEMVLSRNSIIKTVNDLIAQNKDDNDFEKLNEATNVINFITTELQTAVMNMRMLPVTKVFNRFPRLVRDISRDEKKKINLKISGETTEVDKAVIEQIGDPLVHIIRNACSHGIELPELREELNKPKEGTIALSASQEGSNIVIRIKDDGGGLDVSSIRKKVISKKMATAVELNHMSDKETYKYIFEPGFSTAKTVTDVSGRGVGMDVVRTNIEKLNGTIGIDSKQNKGTTFTIKLPLTLAIIQGILMEADEETYIVPLSSVIETVKHTSDDINYVNKKPVFRLRDEVIPIININGVLKGKKSAFTLTEKPYIVIVGLAEKKLGLLIDRFLGQEEVVVKSLGQYLNNTEGVAGATILGDGRVRLIVDLIGLFNLTRKLV